jgi:predicted nucleic acid-binding protein
VKKGSEAAYWDTSAILKLYVPEPDSAYFLELIGSSQAPVFSSSILTAEMLCALFRKEAVGDLKPGGAQALFRRFRVDLEAGRIVQIPYGADVAAEAERLAALLFEQRPPLLIRSLDLIHAASALASRAVILIATDKKLRGVGPLLGVRLLP